MFCFKSIIVELIHQIVELLQNFRFISKSFFIKIGRYIFVIQSITKSQNIND
jgi:hypothetical protein